jgi:hypothetical protein
VNRIPENAVVLGVHWIVDVDVHVYIIGRGTVADLGEHKPAADHQQSDRCLYAQFF